MKHLITGLTLTFVLALGANTRAGLIGQWTFNEGTGTTAADSVGHHDAFLDHGAGWQSSPVGGHALTLDGKAAQASIAALGPFHLTTAVSLEVWVKPEAVPAAGQEARLFGKGYETYTLSYYRDGYVYFYINSGANHVKHPVPTGQYAHVVGTYDGRTLRLYVDGKEVASRDCNEPIQQNDRPLALGGALGHASGGSLDFSFAGAVDEARIYDHALPAAEIEQNFNYGPQNPKAP